MSYEVITPCNLCTLNRLRVDAQANGFDFETEKTDDGWTVVRVNGRWTCSLMEVPRTCAC